MHEPRIARAGDVCVLLEPAEAEIVALRQRQMDLQARFGGRPHERVHLTCQRFELSRGGLLSGVVRHLRRELVAVRPFPVVAVALVQLYHPFWRSRLLRWRIQSSEDVRRLGGAVDRALGAADVAPHFAFASGWEPVLLTALEDVPELDLDRAIGDSEFPHYLFTVRQVVLSRIRGHRQFEILEAIRLSTGDQVPVGGGAHV